MGVFDNMLKKLKMVPEEEEYDEYDEFEEDEEEEPEKKPKKPVKAKRVREEFDDADDVAAESPYANSAKTVREEPERPSVAYNKENAKVYSMSGGKTPKASTDVCMIMPRSFDDATTIADMLLNYKAVVLNMEGIDMAAAQRLIDFASGACYTVGGNLQKISKKIFMIVPQNMNLSGDFDQMIGDMVDLNSLSGSR